jgi:signal transduction histidine kinase/CheY-like chemotaxis protein
VTALGHREARELLGRAIGEVFHPDDRHELASLGPAPARELRVLRRDAGALAVEVVAVPIVWCREPAVAIIARDVSERRQMQAHLLQNDRLVAIGSLAAGVAHEINNPLTYVVANIELVSQALAALAREHRGSCALVDGDALARRIDQLTSALRSAADGAGRVRQIVKDLRTFSRTDGERRALLDVRSVLDPVIHMAWNEIRHRARFTKDCRDVPLVEANEARLGQVFLNLLVNSAHAIPEGRADDNEIRVATYTDAAGRAVVEVADTGLGIAEQHRGRIFDPFFTTKPVGVGTGLGLSICLSTVTSLGGEIAVEAREPSGTTVRVALPPARLEERPRPDSKSGPSSAAERARVLVIDDEPLIGDSLRMSLSDRHEVNVVTKAREALELITKGERYDTILCDLMMPDMTGMDLHAALARVAPAQASRIVFVTGGAFTRRAREFLESVTNRRLEKPFCLTELGAIIEEMGGATRGA